MAILSQALVGLGIKPSKQFANPPLDLGPGNDDHTGTPATETINGLAGDDIIRGLAGRDTLNGGIGNDTLFGGEGKDILNGDAGDDILFGEAAEDSINGGDGNDVIFGGAATDTILGGFGNDIIFGDTGSDDIDGGDGKDVIIGGIGKVDTLKGGNGADLIFGDAGRDTIMGGAGNDRFVLSPTLDTINGGSGADMLIVPTFSKAVKITDNLVKTKIGAVSYIAEITSVERIVTLDGFVGGRSGKPINGNAGDNVLNGTAKSQIILGNAGNDVIDGKGSADIIIGGAGNDTMTGGSGGDVFIFESASTGVDTITDFDADRDFIVLFGTGFGNLPSFFLDADAFHIGSAAADAEDRIIYDSATGNLMFDADGSGAGLATVFVSVGAGKNISVADFMIAPV
jgi:serralysin